MTNLWLSPHGIWYFRKVYLLPSGKRKEIRRSLRTRDKRQADEKVIKILACGNSANNTNASQSNHVKAAPIPLTKKPKFTAKTLKDNLDNYLKFKARHCAEREVLSIQRYVARYIAFLSKKRGVSPDSASVAAEFIDSLDVAVPTKNKHASKIGAFIQWLDKRLDITIRNPFADLKERHQVAPADQRQAYTPEQAKQLIEHAKDVVEWKRWVILLGRYTGMRCNEICQLHRDDIVQQEGTWCVSINHNHDFKRLKTKTSARVIPLPTHQPECFDPEAFLRFVQSRKERLFPEATVYKGNCAHYFGKWFNRWRRKLRLPEFHALRHLVATELKQAGQPEQFVAAILGHAHQSISFGRYGKGIRAKLLLKTLEQTGSAPIGGS